MWDKVLLIAVLAVGIWFMAKGGAPEPTARDHDRELVRSATHITMQDLDLETGKTSIIRAEKVSEKSDHMVLLSDFTLEHADRVHVKGVRAWYDTQTSRLVMDGGLWMETDDGMRGVLKSLTWDRATHRAWTNEPVRLTTRDALITARRAEARDDFEQISLVGGVYAQIAGDALGRFADPLSDPGR